ncbi:uncharacterized protein KY384_004237 [Bacidia gigantensis]|uniref:uncharacterized protein n=1 Tax=Bacidia gigantensis TaxID=2732470 RepID=UPI001D056F8D|nr:uncharacterized protein KY384_004237 [Bacidia gigantensis]KAG8530880.1 hypothetical protein KY384_004237 [Bacidia gigantensis]
MRLSSTHTLLLYFISCAQNVFSYVAIQRHAPKTYSLYDADATPTRETDQARITPGLRLRQLMDPDSNMARYFATRPTSYSSVPYKPATINSTQQCLLWDPSCKGNRREAVLGFFQDTMPKLLQDSCFTTGPDWDSYCTETPKPDPSLISYWSTVRSWMREPSCQSARHEAHDLVSTIPTYDISGGCCGSCGIGGPNVDVYYWESPNANTECLSVIDAYEPLNIVGDEDRLIVLLALVNPWDPATVANAIAKDAEYALVSMTASSAAPTMPFPAASGLHARANPIPLRPRQVQTPTNITAKAAYDSHASTQDQWYKPEPGQPYRPIIAFPPKLTEIDPAFKGCTARLFTGYDPPRALASETAMADDQSKAESNPPPPPAPNAKVTANLNMVQDPQTTETPATEKQLDNQPQTQSKKIVVPSDASPVQPATNSPAKLIDDPSNESDQQMAEIHNALTPSIKSQEVAAPVPANPLPAANTHFEDIDQTQPVSEPEQPPAPEPIATVGGKPIVTMPQSQNEDDGVTNEASTGSVTNENVNAASNPSDNDRVSGKTEFEQQSQGQVPQQQGNAAPPVYKIGDEQLTTGGAPLTIGGTEVFADAGGVIVGDQTYHPTAAPSPVQIGGHTVFAASSGYKIDGLSVLPGGAAVTAGGQTLNIDQDYNLHIDDQVFPVQEATPAKPTVIAGHTVTPVGDGKAIIDGTTLTQGGPPQVISGTPVSLETNNYINIKGQSYQLPTAAYSPIPTVINGQRVVPLPTGLSIAGTTLLPGGMPVTVSGKPISLDQTGNLHFGGSSFPLPPMISLGYGAIPTTIAAQAIVPLSNGDISVAGTTLTPGAPAITAEDGQIISLGSASLTIGTSTIPVSAPRTPFSNSAGLTRTTINGEEVVPVSNGVSVEGTTLTPGGVMTAKDGEVIIMGSSELVVGSSTIPVQIGSAGLGFTLGGLITPASGTGPGSTSPTNFTGKASRRTIMDWSLLLSAVAYTLYIAIIFTAKYLKTSCRDLDRLFVHMLESWSTNFESNITFKSGGRGMLRSEVFLAVWAEGAELRVPILPLDASFLSVLGIKDFRLGFHFSPLQPRRSFAIDDPRSLGIDERSEEDIGSSRPMARVI